MDALIERMKQTLDRAYCAQVVFAYLIGKTEAVTSKILSGQIPLTPELRATIAKALTFLIGLQESTNMPVCFHEIERIEGLWIAFQANFFDGKNGAERVASGAVGSEAVR